ncbi:MAG: Hpt domain-containing protein, partial [Lachnospiraceae bacterium]|nr:Hpt domain-containing protein [Lachnospiraceae bacterium]
FGIKKGRMIKVMTDLQKERLEGLGVNIEETMERFVENEALYFRCLNKLQDDKNFSLMCDAIEEGTDAGKAFDAAHALKGVSANLGLNKLFNELRVITEVFRAGSMDYDTDNLERLKAAYSEAINTIQTL